MAYATVRDRLDGLKATATLLLETLDVIKALDRLPESRRSATVDTRSRQVDRCSELLAEARVKANGLMSELADVVIDSINSDLVKAPAVDATDSPKPR